MHLSAIPPETDKPQLTGSSLDAAWICARYEAVRARLPPARFPATSQTANGLLALAEHFDAFLLDAFGVLNVGEQAIPGAPEAVARLQQMNKPVLVLTNGATLSARDALAKYRAWGFDFETRDVIASRDLLVHALRAWPDDALFGFAAPAVAALDELPVRTLNLGLDAADYDRADAFVFLSTRTWSYEQQALLQTSLARQPRPLLVANPDVAAPRESGFSLEPGHFAHELAELPGVETYFYGKPFANAFDEAFTRLDARGMSVADRRRVAMVGDSLHTDILGGAAAGCASVLITGYGLFRDADHQGPIADTGIVPDYILARV